MEMNELKSKELEAVAGGQTSNPDAGHWQFTTVNMGTTFIGTHRGVTHTWYRIALGDTLGVIAANFGTTTAQIMAWNPNTIQNINDIYGGDTLVVRWTPTEYERRTCARYTF